MMKKILSGLTLVILTLEGNAAFADDNISSNALAQTQALTSDGYASSDNRQSDKTSSDGNIVSEKADSDSSNAKSNPSDDAKLFDNSKANNGKSDSQDNLAAASQKAIQSEGDQGNSYDKKSDEITNIEKSKDGESSKGSDWKSGDNNSDSGDIYKGDSSQGDSGFGDGGKIAAPVPEESTLALSLTGLGLMGWINRRKSGGKKSNV